LELVPQDVDPDEAAAAMAGVMLLLQEEAEQDSGEEDGKWVLAGRLEAQSPPFPTDGARPWRRR
jgi:hypothetical protein